MSICPPVHPLSTKSVHLCPPHPLFRGVDMDTDMDKPADEWAGSGDTTSVSRTLDLTPILGEIARRWRRIHPYPLVRTGKPRKNSTVYPGTLGLPRLAKRDGATHRHNS